MPPQAVARYVDTKHPSARVAWRFNGKRRTMPAGRILRVEANAQMSVHSTDDAWRTAHDEQGTDSTLGIWYADFDVSALAAGAEVQFTVYWPEGRRWEGQDFSVSVTAS